MKKKIIFLLLFPIFLQAQSFIYFDAFSQFATLLNGTSQYWSKANPVNMDLNGSEQLTNGAFATDTTGWITTAVTQRWTGFDGHTALGCDSIVQSAVGSTSRYWGKYPITPTGAKITVEFWAKSESGNTSLTVYFDANPRDSTTFTITTSWAKYVWNEARSSTQTATFLLFWLRGAGTYKIDDVSLTQAYDGMWLAKVKINAMASNASVAQVGAATNSPSLGFYKNSSNYLLFEARSSTGGATATSGALLSSISTQWIILAGTIQRDGNIKSYQNAVALDAGASAAALGSIVFTTEAFNVGYGGSAGRFFTGSISELQVVRFSSLPSDIATTIARIAANKNKPFPKAYANGQIVFWCDWSKGGYDKSGTGNTLAPTAAPLIQKVKY